MIDMQYPVSNKNRFVNKENIDQLHNLAIPVHIVCDARKIFRDTILQRCFADQKTFIEIIVPW